MFFFFREFERIESWHSNRVAESNYEGDEIEAGYKALYEAFGFVGVLDVLTGGDITKEDAVLALPVYQVRTKLQFNSHKQACDKKYKEIQERKMK